MEFLIILLIMAVVGFLAGYATRAWVSRRRRAQYRGWENYTRPVPPAASNSNTRSRGDLGQMLDRWGHRAKTRRRG